MFAMRKVQPSVQEEILKTKMCSFHLAGRCSKGTSCTFAHSEKEMRPQLNLYKTRPCAAFLRKGTCSDGKRCRFAHGANDLRAALPLEENAANETMTAKGSNERDVVSKKDQRKHSKHQLQSEEVSLHEGDVQAKQPHAGHLPQPVFQSLPMQMALASPSNAQVVAIMMPAMHYDAQGTVNSGVPPTLAFVDPSSFFGAPGLASDSAQLATSASMDLWMHGAPNMEVASDTGKSNAELRSRKQHRDSMKAWAPTIDTAPQSLRFERRLSGDSTGHSGGALYEKLRFVNRKNSGSDSSCLKGMIPHDTSTETMQSREGEYPVSAESSEDLTLHGDQDYDLRTPSSRGGSSPERAWWGVQDACQADETHSPHVNFQFNPTLIDSHQQDVMILGYEMDTVHQKNTLLHFVSGSPSADRRRSKSSPCGDRRIDALSA
eukprot:TRINITY_DN896_c1_g1_i2.p1 TRINITY_DN896_c1_g1~~TRINITY_DN896_c1_g1_i2.p1  ORF type:complete len:449 (+),score=73.30 TRINITY_DN896_c1_g1_i2:49-1347(+)